MIKENGNKKAWVRGKFPSINKPLKFSLARKVTVGGVADSSKQGWDDLTLAATFQAEHVILRHEDVVF